MNYLQKYQKKKYQYLKLKNKTGGSILIIDIFKNALTGISQYIVNEKNKPTIEKLTNSIKLLNHLIYLFFKDPYIKKLIDLLKITNFNFNFIFEILLILKDNNKFKEFRDNFLNKINLDLNILIENIYIIYKQNKSVIDDFIHNIIIIYENSEVDKKSTVDENSSVEKNTSEHFKIQDSIFLKNIFYYSIKYFIINFKSYKVIIEEILNNLLNTNKDETYINIMPTFDGLKEIIKRFIYQISAKLKNIFFNFNLEFKNNSPNVFENVTVKFFHETIINILNQIQVLKTNNIEELLKNISSFLDNLFINIYNDNAFQIISDIILIIQNFIINITASVAFNQIENIGTDIISGIDITIKVFEEISYDTIKIVENTTDYILDTTNQIGSDILSSSCYMGGFFLDFGQNIINYISYNNMVSSEEEKHEGGSTVKKNNYYQNIINNFLKENIEINNIKLLLTFFKTDNFNEIINILNFYKNYISSIQEEKEIICKELITELINLPNLPIYQELKSIKDKSNIVEAIYNNEDVIDHAIVTIDKTEHKNNNIPIAKPIDNANSEHIEIAIDVDNDATDSLIYWIEKNININTLNNNVKNTLNSKIEKILNNDIKDISKNLDISKNIYKGSIQLKLDNNNIVSNTITLFRSEDLITSNIFILNEFKKTIDNLSNNYSHLNNFNTMENLNNLNLEPKDLLLIVIELVKSFTPMKNIIINVFSGFLCDTSKDTEQCERVKKSLLGVNNLLEIYKTQFIVYYNINIKFKDILSNKYTNTEPDLYTTHLFNIINKILESYKIELIFTQQIPLIINIIINRIIENIPTLWNNLFEFLIKEINENRIASYVDLFNNIKNKIINYIIEIIKNIFSTIKDTTGTIITNTTSLFTNLFTFFKKNE